MSSPALDQSLAQRFDSLTVEFTWDVRRGKVTGPVTVTDRKSELKNIKSDGTNCGPPQLNGEYEHFQTVSNSTASGDLIEINGTRTYPPASVSNYPGGCSMGAKVDAIVWVAPAEPAVLGMPIMKGEPITVSADRKSFSLTGAENWVWTYTLTIL